MRPVDGSDVCASHQRRSGMSALPDCEACQGTGKSFDGLRNCERCGGLGYDEYAEPTHDRPTCGCKLCFCFNETEYGETCGDCLVGAHQG